MKTVVFFNNKGGVGKTSLVYHLAWMFQDLGVPVLAIDLDPQANLTTAFLAEERLEQLWLEDEHRSTILGAVNPLHRHLGDLAPPHVEPIAEGLGLIPGDLGLSLFEDRLAEAWIRCLDDNVYSAQDAFRVMTAFYRAAAQAAVALGAELVLIDVGPSLGALNRAALIAADHVVVPLGADLFSIQGLRNLGPTLRAWRSGWQDRRRRPTMPPDLLLPAGAMRPIGYVILQHAERQNRPVKAYERWIERIPTSYHRYVLDEDAGAPVAPPDPARLALLKHYRSLMPMAQEAGKPMFSLRPADGAIGSHARAVQFCYQAFEALARRIGDEIDITVPLRLRLVEGQEPRDHAL